MLRAKSHRGESMGEYEGCLCFFDETIDYLIFPSHGSDQRSKTVSARKGEALCEIFHFTLPTIPSPLTFMCC